jgi:hypothetical protein
MTYTPAEDPALAVDVAALRRREGLLIAEVAGRDSIAAALSAIRDRGFATVLPTSVATGTEYGDELSPQRAADRLRSLAGDGVEVLDHVRIGSPKLWAALNGRFAEVVRERFGIYSPCLACHLYMHLCRVPLSWALGNAPIVAGERESHDGKVKLSQIPHGIDAAVRVLASAGVELLEPLRHAHGTDAVQAVLGAESWDAGAELCCVHSGNYEDLGGSVTYDELAYARYLHGFVEPAGYAVVEAWRADPRPDYEAIVRGVLRGPEAA